MNIEQARRLLSIVNSTRLAFKTPHIHCKPIFFVDYQDIHMKMFLVDRKHSVQTIDWGLANSCRYFLSIHTPPKQITRVMRLII